MEKKMEKEMEREKEGVNKASCKLLSQRMNTANTQRVQIKKKKSGGGKI